MLTALKTRTYNPFPVSMVGCTLYAPLWQEDMQGTTLLSYDPNHHSLAVTGAVWGSQGRTFSGGDDLINLDNAVASLATATAGTLEVWAKFPDVTPAANSTIVSFGDTNAVEIIYFYLDTTGILTAVCYDAGVIQWSVETAAALLTNDTWAHIVLIHSSAIPYWIVNGVQVAVTRANETNNAKWFSACTGIDNGRLGCYNINSAGNAGFMTGTIGEFRTYTRALGLYEAGENRLATQWRYQ